MEPSGQSRGERVSHGPHIAYLAVAVAAAVTVLAGFSYATSTMVDRLVGPHTVPPSVSSDSSRVTEAGVPSQALRVPQDRPYRVVIDLDDAGFGALLVTAPAARPLEVVFDDAEADEPITFETVKAVVREEPGGDVLCFPALEPGAYPFSSDSGTYGGVLIVE